MASPCWTRLSRSPFASLILYSTTSRIDGFNREALKATEVFALYCSITSNLDLFRTFQRIAAGTVAVVVCGHEPSPIPRDGDTVEIDACSGKGLTCARFVVHEDVVCAFALTAADVALEHLDVPFVASSQDRGGPHGRDADEMYQVHGVE